MEFDTPVTAVAFAVVLAVLLGGTLTSPMESSTKMMVGGGQVVFLAVTLLLGVKHGRWRAAN
jgi:hypothetical protein